MALRGGGTGQGRGLEALVAPQPGEEPDVGRGLAHFSLQEVWSTRDIFPSHRVCSRWTAKNGSTLPSFPYQVQCDLVGLPIKELSLVVYPTVCSVSLSCLVSDLDRQSAAAGVVAHQFRT